MADIRTPHPQYTANKPKWDQIRTEVEGDAAVKKKGQMYLPFPVSLPTSITDSDDFKRQYEIYLFGALFVNFTAQSIEDLVASVFSRNPIVDEDFPEELEYLNLPDTSKEICTALVSYGNAMLLVDYPTIEGEITREQQEQQQIAAYYSVYDPLDVLNWQTIKVGGVTRVYRVVLHSKIVNSNNQYEDVYRELSIATGVYTIQIYNLDGEAVGAPTSPRGANGETFAEIPAIFLGVEANDTGISPSPIQGIADTNLKHYQNTAELQHTIDYIGHPMLTITGAPPGFIDAMDEPNADGSKKRITVGASQALTIEGETGDAKLLQINPELVHFKQLEQLEKSMAEQGYRIKSDKSGVESAQSLTIRNSGNTSKLSSIATQIENAIKSSMRYINAYMSTDVPDDFKFDLVKNYLQLSPDSNLINTLNGLVNGGRIPDYVLYDYLTETEILSEDVDYETLRNDSDVVEYDVPLTNNVGSNG